MSESLIFRRLFIENSYFSPKMLLLLQFSELSLENRFIWKGMILRNVCWEQNFDLGLSARENGGWSGHCRQKMVFFRVAIATGGPIGFRLKSSSFEPSLHHPAKFQLDRIIRLGWRAVRNRQTHRQVGWLRRVTGSGRLPEGFLRKIRNICQRWGIGLTNAIRIGRLAWKMNLWRTSKKVDFSRFSSMFWPKILVFPLWHPNY